MSTLAKVFIVVNLFLTGTYVFLVASLLAQKNDYREKLREKQNETKTMVTDKENEIKVRKEEIEGVKQEISVKLDEIQKEKLLTENARSHIRILEDRKAEKEQKLPAKLSTQIFNYILTKSNIQALNLESEVALPFHLRMPKFRIDLKGQEATTEEEK